MMVPLSPQIFQPSENENNSKPGNQSHGTDLKKVKPQDFSILIVDDEPDLLEMMAYNLERFGYKVDTASSGNQALSKYKLTPFDLIITDMRMPDGDGLSLLKNIKNLNAKTPVLCITGFSDTPTSTILDLGAYAVFEKPFDIKKINSTVLEIFGISTVN